LARRRRPARKKRKRPQRENWGHARRISGRAPTRHEVGSPGQYGRARPAPPRRPRGRAERGPRGGGGARPNARARRAARGQGRRPAGAGQAAGLLEAAKSLSSLAALPSEGPRWPDPNGGGAAATRRARAERTANERLARARLLLPFAPPGQSASLLPLAPLSSPSLALSPLQLREARHPRVEARRAARVLLVRQRRHRRAPVHASHGCCCCGVSGLALLDGGWCSVSLLRAPHVTARALLC